MAHALTAEDLFQDLKRLPPAERQKFFSILSEKAFRSEDLSHQQVFGHLANDAFTAREAAEYLEVSMSTFRRHVADGRLIASERVGRSQLFAVPELKRFKLAMRAARRNSDKR